MPTMPTPILHHYPESMFSEILRLALGIKGMRWKSVTIPAFAPKPELTPLTGGYRKTPVMQVGADIYCDTAICIELIEALQPEPGLFPAPLGRAGAFGAMWATGPMFMPAVGSALGGKEAIFPEEFWADRKALFGLEPGDFTAHGGHPRAQFLASLAGLEDALDDGRRFFGGDMPGHADAALYSMLWLSGVIDPADVPPRILGNLPKTRAWFERVRAIGHGRPEPMSAQDALAAAKAATPTPVMEVDPDSGFAIGDMVTVRTEDPGADRVSGRLMRLTMREIVIHRQDEQVGEICVHFPRLGQILARA
jgi:glutathione S-transferase